MMEIFLSRNGQRFGPYTSEWLETFVADGSVSPDDLAWTAGRDEWIPLRSLLAELRPAPAAVEKPADAQPAEAVAATNDSLLPAEPAALRPGLSLRVSWRGVAAVATGVVLIVGLVMIANVPKHASIRRNGEHWLLPDDGYTFVDANDSLNWKVRWTPGVPSATRANMLAAETPDTWKLAPGYVADGTGNPVWTPSRREPEYPNVSAGTEPGTWVPDPGYVVTGSATAPTASWRAGVRLPHMTSVEQERYWHLDDGYDMDQTVAYPTAVWTPGKRRYDNPHVYALQQEGKFQRDADYEWLTDEADDYRTFNSPKTAAALNTAAYVDGLSVAPNCQDATVLAAVELARDRYGAIALDEVHPAIANHITSVHQTLTNGATMINTCFVVGAAPDVIDFGAAAYCAFFSKSNYEQCTADYQKWHGVIEGAGKVGNTACRSAAANFWKRLDELREERLQLSRSLANTYHMQLASPQYIVSCRD